MQHGEAIPRSHTPDRVDRCGVLGVTRSSRKATCERPSRSIRAICRRSCVPKRRSSRDMCRRRRRGAIRSSPARTRTATRAASRSSGPRSSTARSWRTSRPTSSPTIVKQRQEQTVERTPGLSEFPGATSPLHWFENYRAANSRAWLVTDETDGKVPPHDRGSHRPQRRPRACAQRARPGRQSPKIAACTTAASRAAFPAR